jgi:hypothetical protein
MSFGEVTMQRAHRNKDAKIVDSHSEPENHQPITIEKSAGMPQDYFHPFWVVFVVALGKLSENPNPLFYGASTNSDTMPLGQIVPTHEAVRALSADANKRTSKHANKQPIKQ